jgi:hypothetical protein
MVPVQTVIHQFGHGDWRSRFRAEPVRESVFPWSEEFLLSPCPFQPDRMVAQTHFAFLGRSVLPPDLDARSAFGHTPHGDPLTAVAWEQYRGSKYGLPYVHEKYQLAAPNGELGTGPCSTPQDRWYLLYCGAVGTEEAHLAELPPEYGVATLAELLLGAFLHYDICGGWPFPDQLWMRTRPEECPNSKGVLTLQWPYFRSWVHTPMVMFREHGAVLRRYVKVQGMQQAAVSWAVVRKG